MAREIQSVMENTSDGKTVVTVIAVDENGRNYVGTATSSDQYERDREEAIKKATETALGC